MLLFFKRGIVFAMVALLGYCIIFLLWSNLIPFQAFKKNLNFKMGSYGNMYSRIQEADTVSNVDILVLGSSHAYRGFDPRVFKEYGLKVFNLGSSNQTPQQALVLTKTYLKELNPQLVIYEVYPGIFQQDGLESTLDLVANGPLNKELLKMTIELNHLKAYNALLYRVYLEAFGKYNDFVEPIRKPVDHDTYIAGGYVQKDDSYLRDQSLNGTHIWNFRDDQWKHLNEVKSMLDAKNIELLMVQSPVDSTYYRNGSNNLEIDQKFQGLGDYINFNSFMSLHYGEDLYDLHHLKQSGVEKFNRLLIEIIREWGYLD